MTIFLILFEKNLFFFCINFGALCFSDGDVRVNWVTVSKNNTTIRSGDMISVSGKGRLKVR